MESKDHTNVRRGVLFGVLIVMGIAAGIKWQINHTALNAGAKMSAAVPNAMEVTDTGPLSPAHGSTVWMQGNHEQYIFSYTGLITQEIFRQAVLMAARDELGLQTRDASLREWRSDPPTENTLQTYFRGNDITLHRGANGARTFWKHFYSSATWPDDYGVLVETAESLSRGDFVDGLQKQGWTGSPNAIKPDAPAPQDAEEKLKEMEELSQISVLRETHAAIRSDGESPQRLAVLVRAYANLGQLTRYHWSVEYAVYTARSLLYAQRMVAKNPGSAFALWHRAYARAMAGMQADAMEDLAAAAESKSETAPPWVPLLEPYCKYQTGRLFNIVATDPSIQNLGTYLAFLTVEHSGSQGATMNLAQVALGANPDCLRIIDAMCDQTGPGMLNELSQMGPQQFSQILRSKLEKLPSFPPSVTSEIERLRQPGGNPAGRETICQELIDLGAPEKDTGEPSWAAVARLVQETTFAHVRRMADVISQRWGVDASEYVSESTHLIAGHPFSFLVNTYGLWHTPDAAAIRASLVEPKSALAITTVRQIPLYVLEGQAQSSGPQSAQTVWGSILQNRDTNSFDMEAIINCYVGQENCALVISELKRLQKVSPQSPVLIALEIRNNWDKDKAAEWEADHGDYPTVALALGQKYLELKQWSDAERCLGKYIAVSPDFTGYTALAQVYKSQQQDDRWVATLNEFLGQTDYGLQHATVQVQLANYYMDKGDFKSALPYADAAAGTASGWGMLCAVEAHTGTGDWSAAQQLLIDEKDHYSESPFRWYAWCVHTGHGSLDAARDAMVDYFATKGDALTNQEMLELGCFQLSRKNDAGAIKTFQRRVKNNPGPVSLLHIAIAADESHDNATRDAALEQIKTVPEHESCFGRLGFALQEAIKAGPDASPDPQAMNGILTGRGPIDSMRICALTARFLDNRNHPDEATTYLRRCIGLRGDCEDRLIIDAALRDRGIDPMAAHDTTLP